MSRQRGFTLMELMVVIGLFSVMSVMAYGGLNSVLTTRVRIEESLERTAAYQKVYLRLRGDFQQVQRRGIRDGFGERQPALKADRFGNLEATRGGWRNPLGLPRSGLERVLYRFNEKTLLRDSWRALDRAQDSVPVSAVLLDRVDEIEWRFMDRSRQWQNQWPPESESQTDAPPPLAVELTLQTQDWGELRFVFATGAGARTDGVR